jgi:hypothetical protein
MTLYPKQTLPDGSTIVRDDATGEEWIVKPGQWAEIYALSTEDARRRRLLALIEENRADPTGGRSERDELARETMQNATTGEAHQAEEESR